MLFFCRHAETGKGAHRPLRQTTNEDQNASPPIYFLFFKKSMELENGASPEKGKFRKCVYFEKEVIDGMGDPKKNAL